MQTNIYQNQSQQLDAMQAQKRRKKYKSDGKHMEINWRKFDFNVANFYKNKAAFLLLCQQLSVKHSDPNIREKAIQFVNIQKEKIKVDQCENQINHIKKKLDEVYTLIINAKEDNSRAEKDCIQKENQLKVVTNFYEKMEYIQETKDQKHKSYVQRQKEQEIQAIKNYDSKEGVQALRQQIFKLVKQQKILLQKIKTSFDPSYVQDQQKHNSVLQVLSQWEQIKTKAASLRQQVYIKAELYQKQSFKLSGISSQVDQQNLNIENLEKQLQGLKNPFFSSSIQVGHSASQVIETNVFNRRTDENVKRQHRIVQSGYSQLVKYALYLWAFVIIVIFLKESPIARSIQPNISPDLRERF